MAAHSLMAKLGFFSRLRSACKASGQRMLPQILDIVRLRLGPTRLGAHEYINFCLYDSRKYSFAQKREFGGNRCKFDILNSLNSPEWTAIGSDKLINYAILSALGLPHPEIYAIASRRQRYFGDIPCFIAREPLADFIRSEMTYPFFAKPARGYFGIGSYAVSAYDASSDSIELYDGNRMPVPEFVDQIMENATSGYLFHECLRSHPEIAEICGNTVTTCRLDIFVENEGPRLFYNNWKIPTGRNMNDNFHDGLTGNLAAFLDADTGVVRRLVNSIGIDQKELVDHPDSGKRLHGFQVPDWDKIKTLCFTAATAFPGLRVQGWDVALTPKGPVLVELNATSDLFARQYISGEGIYNAALIDFLARYGRKKKR